MHLAASIVTWAAAVAGVGLLLYSLVGLLSPAGRAATTRLALGRFWMAVFVLVETCPRLAGWSSGIVLVLSVLALAPLLLAVRALRQR